MAVIRFTLRSDLCIGSGEATGVTVDRDIRISAAGLPYIPGRCIKGCLRQAAEQLKKYGCKEAQDSVIDELFGTKDGRAGAVHPKNAVLPGAAAMEAWLCRESNKLPRAAAKPINVEKLFSHVRGQTSLKDGVFVKGTLRSTRVVNRFNALEHKQATVLEAPVSLYISPNAKHSAEELAVLLKKCCQALRHMGNMRNRGLGSVKVELLDPENDLVVKPQTPALSAPDAAEANDTAEIRFRISLDAPVTLPGCAEDLWEIPARSVIGCVAHTFLRAADAEDPLFRDLFLNGTVCWSALTPVADGQRSVPTPLMLVYHKNKGEYKNRYPVYTGGEKQKTLDGTYAVPVENGCKIVSVHSHTQYHYSTKEGLYMQTSLDAGMIYGGTVTVPVSLAETVKSLLTHTDFAFGRSRSAQYASCSLCGEPVQVNVRNDMRPTQLGEPVYVVLQSDLLLASEGIYRADNTAVRRFLAEKLDLEDKLPSGCTDYCQYHTVGGYNMMWQLQKPQLPVVRGGSVYVFCAKGSNVPTRERFGEFLQEGFGLCRIYTAEEMKRLQTIKKVPAAQNTQAVVTPHCSTLKSALLAQAGRELIREFVYEYNGKYGVGVKECNIKTQDGRYNRWSTDIVRIRPGMIGRLRLILSEAEDYPDFIERVNQIKTSDTHSRKKYADRDIILALLKEFFGEDQAKPDIIPMLKSDKELLNAIETDADAKEKLSAAWREPLDMLLHLAYYSKGGRKG